MYFYEIILDNIPTVLTYCYHEYLEEGSVIFVKIRDRKVLGIVWKLIHQEDKINSNLILGSLPRGKDERKLKDGALNPTKVKPIYQTSEMKIELNLKKFIDKLSEYTLYPKSIFVKSIIPKFYGRNDLGETPKRKRKEANINEKIIIKNDINLTVEQEEAFQKINYAKNYASFLLYGATGSGKTELCIKLILEKLKEGKQALILLPEIALINQWETRIKKYVDCPIILYHSLLGKSKTNWMHLNSGKPAIIIGARSAVFLPFKNLGLIIVDEEHDSSYKQDTKPIYNGRDAAVMRAYYENCPVILASATPSLESFNNVDKGKYILIRMISKFHKSEPTEIVFVPMETNFLSEKILREIKSTYLENKKSIIFVNRRGYGKKVMCNFCKTVLQCKNCDYCLVYHKFNNRYLCHLCNYEKKDNYCEFCKQHNSLQSYGLGVEKIEEILNAALPGIETTIFSSDTTATNKSLLEKIEEINNDKPGIIVGTQMLSKGHDLHNLKLVIILDLNISNTDFRGREKSLQLLTQILGRVGRREGKHKAILQIDFNSPFADFLKKHFQEGKITDYRELLQQEMEDRQKWLLPPFVDMINIYVQHSKKDVASTDATSLFQEILGQGQDTIRVSVPVTMPIARKKALWRYVINIIIFKKQHIQFLGFLSKQKKRSEVIIDVNPIYIL